MDKARPNPAHFALADLEELGFLRTIITQNIDGLHQEARSNNVIEFHGNNRWLVCQKCGERYPSTKVVIDLLPPEEEMPSDIHLSGCAEEVLPILLEKINHLSIQQDMLQPRQPSLLQSL